MGIRISMHLLIGVDNLEVDNVGNIFDKRFFGEKTVGLIDKEISFPDYDKDKLFQNEYRSEELQKVVMRSIMKVWADEQDKEKFPAYNLIEFNTEFGLPNIIGVKISSLPYADNVLYGLAAIYPEFRETGFKILPSVELEDDTSLASSLLKIKNSQEAVDETEILFDGYHNLIASKEKLINEKHNYLWFSTDFDIWAKCALYIFEQLGFNFTEKDLKLILYWKWS